MYPICCSVGTRVYPVQRQVQFFYDENLATAYGAREILDTGVVEGECAVFLARRPQDSAFPWIIGHHDVVEVVLSTVQTSGLRHFPAPSGFRFRGLLRESQWGWARFRVPGPGQPPTPPSSVESEDSDVSDHAISSSPHEKRGHDDSAWPASGAGRPL